MEDSSQVILNSLRELCKVSGCSTSKNKEILRFIKNMLDIKDFGLKVHHTKAIGEMQELICFVIQTMPETY